MAGEPRKLRDLLHRYVDATRLDPEPLRSALDHPPEVRHPPYALGAVGALAAAALVALVLFLPSMSPPPSGPELGVEPALVHHPLPAGLSHPIPGVSLEASGSGSVAAAGRRVALDWTVGRLDVEVTPGEDLAVSVTTPEAIATVVGTGFRVERSALGTEVTVRHGVVEVRCTNTEPVRVEAGASRMCLPTTPASFLGRARALEAAGAPSTEVRAAAEHGLAGQVSPSVRGELEVVRIRSFLAETRPADALAAAEAYLRAGYPDRREEVLRLAVTLAEQMGDCARQRTWRRELGEPAPVGCAP